jgi:hypothetical protein
MCISEDWIGVFIGTTSCNGSSGDAIITITKVSENTLQGTIETGITTNLEPFAPENCTHKSNINSGSLISVSYELEGNQITIIEQFETGSCTTTAVK